MRNIAKVECAFHKSTLLKDQIKISITKLMKFSLHISDVLWKKFPNATEKEILAPIRSWLAHAAERREKENKDNN